mmetsp:Transcript_112022/g.349118  ORF Transcript_112022/g.349118 Transcript_112022/m.349118 type:complete len:132 (-) Transcript_112022:79-474(-)|eukprot:CAMPEP_0204581596 /NCGR_PEP_ID=MMETSP0661-20131031/44740_1 /ASSEMBLY_ACC=CAM_ASM_000606 /TAXON_ID=109239 /ORGANISM="Alexandrium margalefi, Strain AMGDE01CS-322" /LENGTH=131 /DNA_ID=CAMNT_0051590807 /DNA_START=88 /DNA_END=483 /DNA_ORIENTATION=+
MTRQLYGEERSPNLWRTLLVVLVVALFCLVAWLTAARPQDISGRVKKQVQEDSALGPGRDQRGCLHSAGYTWCEGLGKCIRPWRDSCPGGTEFCRHFCAKGPSAAVASRGAHSVFCRCTEDGQAADYVHDR